MSTVMCDKESVIKGYWICENKRLWKVYDLWNVKIEFQLKERD
jgi:hypothetical protein